MVFSVPSATVMEVLSAFFTRIAGAFLPEISTPLKISFTVPGSAFSSGISTQI